MKIAIVTDAWYPQINGVVRTLAKTREGLEALGGERTGFRLQPVDEGGVPVLERDGVGEVDAETALLDRPHVVDAPALVTNPQEAHPLGCR